MAKQEISGKAFEFACIYGLYMLLKDNVEVYILKDINYLNVQAAFDELPANKKKEYLNAALRGIKIICALEPNLECPNMTSPLRLYVQSDKSGQQGDVRDVICLLDASGWNIGISCKHDHEAVKHSRLSRTIDFGKEWVGYPVSQNYHNQIKPIFDKLDKLKDEKISWSEIDGKDEKFYKPLLEAFLSELTLLAKLHPDDLPEKLLTYLLGRNDFYKLIAHTSEKATEVKAFNMYGTLGYATRTRKPQSKISQLKMPTQIINMAFKKNSLNTVLIHFDNGWAISLRIHNASKYVESSLKFDIQLVGVPASMGTRVESWDI